MTAILSLNPDTGKLLSVINKLGFFQGYLEIFLFPEFYSTKSFHVLTRFSLMIYHSFISFSLHIIYG